MTARARSESRTWAEIAAVCGVLAVIAYSLIVAVPLSLGPALIVVSIFGPALAAASGGLYEVLRLYRTTASLKIGVVANVAAGVAVTMTLFAQLAFKEWLELRFPPGAGREPHRPHIRPRTDSSSGSTSRGTCFFRWGPSSSPSTCGGIRGSAARSRPPAG